MKNKKKSVPIKILSAVGKTLGFVVTLVLIVAVTLLVTMQIICRQSDYAKTTFITTVLETGQMKFLAHIALSEEEIQSVVDANSMKQPSEAVIDEGLINVVGGEEDNTEFIGSGSVAQQDIEVIEITGLTYKATLMIVKDPSRISLATIYKGDDQWPETGVTLQTLASRNGAVAAINGGLYNSEYNSGGYPYGVVVSHGEIVRNKPDEWAGLVLVGLTDKNILQMLNVSRMSPEECEKAIRDRGIRDAVCFQEANSASNNHFVQLIVNGKPRDASGRGSGLNPRTAIGQRADGTMLLLVTDGRGANGHAGASASDLIDIMTRYGAVNAANLDGGSSTCMYYDGKYLQNSVTFYYSQGSWRLPFAFIVK